MVPFDTQYATFYWSAIVNIALSCTIFECICSIRADLCCVCCVVLTSPSPSFFRSFVCQHESSLPHKVSVCSYIPYHSIDSFVCFLQYMYLCLLHDECVVNGEIQNCVVFKGLPTSLPQTIMFMISRKKIHTTHVVSLGKIASAIGQSTVCSLLGYHTNEFTQHITEKYWMKKTLLKSVYQKVTFHQSDCTIQDPVSQKADGEHRSFLEQKN